METNMGNSELLYEVIDTLTDEEFEELLNNLDIADKAEEVAADKNGEAEKTGEALDSKFEERKRLISEKLEELAQKQKTNQRRQLIKEKIENARKRAQIQEKLEACRKRDKVQEALKNARKNPQTKVPESKQEFKSKIQEKIELARKKKAVMERVMAAKAAAAKKK